jgi:hypothetical protein
LENLKTQKDSDDAISIAKAAGIKLSNADWQKM